MTIKKGILNNKLVLFCALSVSLIACAPKNPPLPKTESVVNDQDSITTREKNKIPMPLTTKEGAKQTQEPLDLTGPQVKHSGAAAAITSWEISGGMAAKSPKEAWTAAFNWSQQSPHHYQLRLIGPLGGKTILVKQSNGQVTYQEGQRVITAKSAEGLLLKETGIRMPIASLYYWTRGLPAPNAPHSFKTVSGVPVLNQSGYSIAYLNYSNINGVKLPTKVQLHGSGVMIKLSIRQWNFR